MPFYFAGYLYGQYRDKIIETNWGETTVDMIVAVCLGLWLLTMTRYKLYALPDSGFAIILRAASSMAGCITVCGLCKGIYASAPVKQNALRGGASWTGVHSLEIYLTHYLLLSPLKMLETPIVGSIQGTALMMSNYVVTVLLTVMTVKMVNTSKVLRLVLYGNTD